MSREAGSRARVWALTWRFARRAVPYWRRILLAMSVVLVFAAAKSGQSFLIKPIIDNLQGKEAVVDQAPKPLDGTGAGRLTAWAKARLEPLRAWVRSWDLRMVGINAVVLDRAVIGPDSIVGAGALVTPGTVIPPGTLAVGSPARVKRELTQEEREFLRWAPAHYVDVAREYLAGGTTTGP